MTCRILDRLGNEVPFKKEINFRQACFGNPAMKGAEPNDLSLENFYNFLILAATVSSRKFIA